jgi:hypothetical protein
VPDFHVYEPLEAPDIEVEVEVTVDRGGGRS